MPYLCSIMILNIEWDENKNQKNIKNHGISFEQAKYVFADPLYVEFYDGKHSDDEDRYIILGKVSKVLMVIVTYRANNSIVRIVSAREATKKEVRLYEENY